MSRARAIAGRILATLVQGARLAIGQPDYDRYVAHLRRHHPDHPIPAREAFFREREQARYGRGRSRCC
ncbi:YbdD/YjiX family protein [Lysobacter humi (ex Lee et al. 2017)]